MTSYESGKGIKKGGLGGRTTGVGGNKLAPEATVKWEMEEEDVQLAQGALAGDYPLAQARTDILGPALEQEEQEWTAPVSQHPQE